ncbi:glycosyltransferase [Streptomyces goshikiensis]|uniref:glycosyltransferase n=1 Tax=Streptomyces goshikiensis TaxID=1942 RepID=UPI0037945B79
MKDQRRTPPAPPRLDGLRVLLATWGTTGDIAPYTGIAVALRDAGCHVTVVTSRRYAAHFTVHGLTVRTMPLDRQEALATQPKSRSAKRLNGQDITTTAATTMLNAAADGTDILLTHPLLHPQGALIAEGLNLPCLGVYTVAHAMMLPRLMTAAPRPQHHLTDLLVKLALSPAYAPALAQLRTALALRPRRCNDVVRVLRHQAVAYGINAALLPDRYPLPPGHHTTGHWAPARTPGWKPDSRLTDFLDSGPAPVYFGFGSMHRIDRDTLIRTITTSTRQLRIRAVVQAGWADLAADTDDVITIGECPHDWLFPRTLAAVHHAGPGTVHASLEAATPTLPVPVALDQPYWAHRLTRLGLTPTAIPIRRLTAAKLTGTLRQLLEDGTYRRTTQALATTIRRQAGTTNLIAHLHTQAQIHPPANPRHP